MEKRSRQNASGARKAEANEEADVGCLPVSLIAALHCALIAALHCALTAAPQPALMAAPHPALMAAPHPALHRTLIAVTSST